MKKYLILTALVFGNLLFAQTTSIPDNNFEQALIDLGHDDVLDGEVLTSNISNLTELDVSFKAISNLIGIKDFTNLTSLNVNTNNLSNLTEIDNLTNLTYLDCGSNLIETLDLSKNLLLKHLACNLNALEELDLSKNTNLTTIYLDGNQQLKSLNLKNGNNQNIERLSTKSFDGDIAQFLSCINVDDAEFMNTNWSSVKDDNVIYSENCDSSLNNEIINQNKRNTKIVVENHKIIIDKEFLLFNILGQIVSNENLNGLYLVKIQHKGGKIETHKVLIP